jgi:hypothetical protein
MSPFAHLWIPGGSKETVAPADIAVAMGVVVELRQVRKDTCPFFSTTGSLYTAVNAAIIVANYERRSDHGCQKQFELTPRLCSLSIPHPPFEAKGTDINSRCLRFLTIKDNFR